MTSGRRVSELEPFTFPDSGITVRLRRVGPRTIEQIVARVSRQYQREHPRPRPPMVPVVVGESEQVLEPNVNDPDYRARLQEWETGLQTQQAIATMRFLVDYGIVADVDQEAVRALREALSPEDLMTEDGKPYTDHQVYVEHVCMISPRDIQAVVSAILGISQPSNDRIEAMVDRFQSNT